MALTPIFTLAPNPHWVIIDNFSKLPVGAAIYTYSSLIPSRFKAAYQDAAGTIPFSQPIIGAANGTMPPIFWEFDPNNPQDTYYIRVYDSANETTHQFLWDFNGLSGGGSGGGTVVTSTDVENLVVNNVFYRNIGNQAGSPSLPTSITLAPSAHEGFVNDPANVNVINNGPVGPDVIFAKTNTTSSDSITFSDFSPLGVHALPGADITPQQYFNYSCSGAGAGETYKYVQFPISQGVQNLSAQPVTVRFYGRCNSGTPTVTLKWRQFFGSGGGSADVTEVIGGAPITLTGPDFSVTTITATNIPSVTGATQGTCGNDGLFLQICFPLSPATTSIDFIKPEVYLGTSIPLFQYDTNDQIDSLINTPRTGDIRTTINNVVPGWVLMNDGTIGNGSSAATARANKDTYPLFSLLWNLFSTNQALAPMYTSAGAAAAYGADATADFVANNQISLTRNLGRVMAGALPVAVSQAFTNVANVMTIASTASFHKGVPVVVSGGTLPTGIVAGVTYYAIPLSTTTMSLALTPELAIAGTPIALTTNASGTVTVPAHGLGVFLGEETHAQTLAELATHTHAVTFNPTSTNHVAPPPGPVVLCVNDVGNHAGVSTTSGSAGSGVAFNIMQPTVFMNVFIKL